MRVYTIRKSSVILAVGILLILSITFWLNSHLSEDDYSPPSSAEVEVEDGFNFDNQEDDDDKLMENETNSESDVVTAAVNNVNDVQAENDYDDYQRNEDEEDDEENQNPVFRKGDFDEPQYANNDTMQVNSVDDEAESVKASASSYDELTQNSVNWPIVEDEIFWSNYLEQQMPKGLNDERVRQLQLFMRESVVRSLLAPTWNQCGRPKNQIVVLADGSRACARYRLPHHYLVQGEVLSYYLARLLNITNVPVLVLSQIDPSSLQWSHSVEIKRAISEAGWEINSTVALIRWVSDLERSQMPEMILTALTNGISISSKHKQLKSVPSSNLIELMQWSDLIIFDYLTGNYDRVASMQDTADKENRPSVFNDTVHNLVRCRTTGAMLLIDNESGFLDAYSLLYSEDHPNQGQRFLQFHKQMLQTFCVFRRFTVKQLQFLASQPDPHRFLFDYVSRYEPLFEERAVDPTKNKLFRTHFKRRLDQVNSWINKCQHTNV